MSAKPRPFVLQGERQTNHTTTQPHTLNKQERNLMAIAKIKFILSQPDYEGIVDIAGYGINYWARAAAIDNTGPDGAYKSYTVRDGYGKDKVKVKITRAGMERAIVNLLTDQKLHNRIMNPIYQLVLRGEGSDVDAEVGDAIIQQAMFGEVIYG